MNEKREKVPVYWQISKEQHHVVRLQRAYVEVRHVLRRHVHDRYYQ